MDMLIAWGLVLVAGLGALAGIFVLSRSIASPWWRSLLRCVAAVWLLVPAKIQQVDGVYAPAFIVAIFEGLFQQDGRPAGALLILGIGTVLVLALFLAMAAIRWRRGQVSADSTEPEVGTARN